MKLEELLDDVEIIASKMDLKENVGSICSDSRKSHVDGVFVAIKGSKRNGNNYINDALDRGIKCVITDSEEAYAMCNKSILVKNARMALAYIWNNFYEKPAQKLKIAGITGTNGKTSCAYYLYNILRSAGKRTGLISTVECLIEDTVIRTDGGSDVIDIPSAMTTPDPEILYSIFYEMVKQEVEYVVMEVSSHSLEQCKLSPIIFEVGAFTNLSCEHLDFHENMELYYCAKRSMFKQTKFAVVNIDNQYGARLYKEISCKKVSCSFINGDYIAKEINVSLDGLEYKLHSGYEIFKVIGKIGGEFSVYNTLISIAVAISLGLRIDDILKGILNTEKIKGRLERIAGSNVFIDYAHTPYAMENVLHSVRIVLGEKRLIVLFGCGGDRDREKRGKMAKIASKIADKVIITSDNSRNERTEQIIMDILSGILPNTDFLVIPNRADAIRYALSIINSDDVLLLLGKGHESYEIDKNGKHYFSEREIVEEVLQIDKNKKIYGRADS